VGDFDLSKIVGGEPPVETDDDCAALRAEVDRLTAALAEATARAVYAESIAEAAREPALQLCDALRALVTAVERAECSEAEARDLRAWLREATARADREAAARKAAERERDDLFRAMIAIGEQIDPGTIGVCGSRLCGPAARQLASASTRFLDASCRADAAESRARALAAQVEGLRVAGEALADIVRGDHPTWIPRDADGEEIDYLDEVAPTQWDCSACGRMRPGAPDEPGEPCLCYAPLVDAMADWRAALAAPAPKPAGDEPAGPSLPEWRAVLAAAMRAADGMDAPLTAADPFAAARAAGDMRDAVRRLAALVAADDAPAPACASCGSPLSPAEVDAYAPGTSAQALRCARCCAASGLGRLVAGCAACPVRAAGGRLADLADGMTRGVLWTPGPWREARDAWRAALAQSAPERGEEPRCEACAAGVCRVHVRPEDLPCAEFILRADGEAPDGECETDGHYLCREACARCVAFNPTCDDFATTTRSDDPPTCPGNGHSTCDRCVWRAPERGEPQVRRPIDPATVAPARALPDSDAGDGDGAPERGEEP